eukprot:CAMPEP_0167805686 /NCGR_PEP_ID=MMETSP0111_2-20121227/21344_1 /TAXON_ID=91324 /ORGANISM="Lotharella globosa, Strain CCCM811" /LENGTH=33 /DNA_ID= /DNA_START= /DNA_END= /DNA_ORIENTATION=
MSGTAGDSISQVSSSGNPFMPFFAPHIRISEVS